MQFSSIIRKFLGNKSIFTANLYFHQNKFSFSNLCRAFIFIPICWYFYNNDIDNINIFFSKFLNYKRIGGHRRKVRTQGGHKQKKVGNPCTREIEICAVSHDKRCPVFTFLTGIKSHPCQHGKTDVKM